MDNFIYGLVTGYFIITWLWGFSVRAEGSERVTTICLSLLWPFLWPIIWRKFSMKEE